MNDAPIGVFDSGIGGLTVAAAIMQALPAERVTYLGDTARVPYGPKSPATVVRYSRQIAAWLIEQGVKAIVIACNTATAHALEVLQAECPVPVLGVVQPGARAAVAATRNAHVGVIGTSGTINSGAYTRAIAALAPVAVVTGCACPLFVPLVEEGWLEHPATRLIAASYLQPVQDAGVDTLVLGCTHYPFLIPLLQDIAGPAVTIIDPGPAVARELRRRLEMRQLLSDSTAPGRTRYWTSTDPDHLKQVVKNFYSDDIEVGTLPAA